MQPVNVSFCLVLGICGTQWVPDEMVATCVIDIWPNFVTIKKGLGREMEEQVSNNTGYQTLWGINKILFQ